MKMTIMKKNVDKFFPCKDERIKTFDICFAIVLFWLIAASFMYGDTKAFVYYIFDFWDSIVEGGGIRHFREYAYEMYLKYRENGITEVYAANYNFSIHLILGIWGFPVWIWSKAHNTIGRIEAWMLIYVKMLFCVFGFFTATVLKKVCFNLNMDKKHAKFVAYLFGTSSLLLVETGLIGQIDILGLPFIFLGIDAFQRGNRKRFLMYFSIAITFKQFPFFIFFPLLLLIEKNVMKIGLESVLALSFSKIIELPLCQNTEAEAYKSEFSLDALRVLLGNKIPVFNRDVPLLIILLGIVCAFCYLTELKNQDEINHYSIFVSTLSITLVMISFDNNPYWNLILAPFYSLLVVYNSKEFKNLILFETLGMIALIISQYNVNYWCFDPVFCRGTVLEVVCGYPNDYITMYRLVSHFGIHEFSGAIYAFFVVCLGIILYLSRPGKIQQDNSVEMKKYICYRMVINSLVAFLPIMLYVVSIILFG